METCAVFRTQLWDLVYDLLDAGETESVRAHLATCTACQSELEQVEFQQQRLADAALLKVSLVPFAPPLDEPVTIPVPVKVADVERRRRARLWPGLLTAAAAVVLLALPYVIYQQGVGQRQAAREKAEQELAHLVAQREEFRQDIPRKEQALPGEIRAHYLRLQVLGPATYQPQAADHYRILTTHLDGQPADAHVTARVVDANRKVLFEKQDVTVRGALLLSLPPDLPVGGLASTELQVTARDALDLEEAAEELRVLTPAYTTRLLTDKPIYRPGERGYFRSLTLNHFTLKPPDRYFAVRYTLTDPHQGTREITTGATRLDGIGGGEFQLQAGDPEGEYTLAITEQHNRFPSASCKLLVSSGLRARLRKTLTFDRSAYQPGDRLEARLKVEGLDGSGPAVNLPVTVIAEVDGKDSDLPRSFRTDSKGQVVIPWILPGYVSKGHFRLKVDVAEQETHEKLVRHVPRAFNTLDVEFFPEGGDLIVGVPNRVYFRVRNPDGDPVALQGEIVDGHGAKVTDARTVPANGRASLSEGLGSFVLTPQAEETYQLRIASPAGIKNLPMLPPAQAEGIVLNLPAGVSRENEPLEATIHVTGPERELVIGAACRGRFVAQEAITAKPGSTRVRLLPLPGSSGVIRFTVFERQGRQLRPAAERLVYRYPAERLVLGLQPSKEQYAVGDAVRLTVRSQNESGKPEPAWLLVSVVNEDALGQAIDPARQGLPAAFYLTSELLKPEDLEGADILLRDEPGAAAQLDLFLATQGWRRFSSPRGQPAMARDDARTRFRDMGIEPGALVSLDNSEEVERKSNVALAQAMASLRQTASVRDQELTRAGEERLQAARSAEGDLEGFQARAGLMLRFGLGAGVLVLFGLGCLLLLTALVRVLRSREANTPYFAGAFASLLVCAGVFLTVKDRLANPEMPAASTMLGPLALKLEQPPAFQRGVQTSAPLNTSPLKAPEDAGAIATAVAKGATSPRLREDYELNALPSAATRPKTGPLAVMRQLLHNASPTPQPANPEGVPPLVLREYAYLRPRGLGTPADSPDTLLWQPLLFAADGTARVAFHLPVDATSFRIQVEAHSATGRLGSLQQALKAGSAPAPSK